MSSSRRRGREKCPHFESSAERALAAQYLALYRPSAERYEDYALAGEVFLAGGPAVSLRYARAEVPISGVVSRRRSRLFDADYFIAWLDDDLFKANNPFTDAAAEVAWDPNVSRPPLILCPSSKRSDRSAYFRSILEHEIVHINQLLSGQVMPARKKRPSAEDLLQTYFAHVRLEHTANFIQRVHWPTRESAARFKAWGISLEHWALLRGCTQALEELLFDLLHRRTFCADETLGTFLANVPISGLVELRPLEVRKETLAWFVERWSDDVLRALHLVLEHRPPDLDPSPLRPVLAWTRRK